MIGAMKRLAFGMAVCCLAYGNARAQVSVAPVIVEAVQVQKGQVFEIFCQNWGEEAIGISLSLALFDQQETGNVVFLENGEALQRVNEVLSLDQDAIVLEAQQKSAIRVELIGDDFDNTYAVLFVKPNQVGVQTRFAVLFLLSTAANEIVEMSISPWVKEGDDLTFTVQNNGLRHSPWEGEIHFFDALDQLSEKREITSGLVLAGRSRDIRVPLPSWVQRADIYPIQVGTAP